MYIYTKNADGSFVVEGGLGGFIFEMGRFAVETDAMIVVHFLNGGSGVSYSTVYEALTGGRIQPK